MSTISATDAKNNFGQVLDQAQHEPVHGRDIAVVVSAAEYQRLSAANADSKVSPRVQQLLAESMKQRRSVYEVLAK